MPPGPLHAAHWFLERGWTPLPIVPRGKTPLLPWRRLQRARPTPADLEQWWALWPDANVGIVTGGTSGLAVLDLDSDEAQAQARKRGLPDEAPLVRTGRGEHIYCRAESPVATVALSPGLEVRGDGAYVVAPPSLHPSGTRYTWLIPPLDALPPLPDWARSLRVERLKGCAPGWVVRALRGVEEGRRNVTCARLTGYFVAKGVPPEVVEAMLLGWNHLNRLPLPDAEVLCTVASIVGRGRRERTEALPYTERSLVEFLAGPWAQECTHGERSTYQALCVVEWVRGLSAGASLFVSYRELHSRGAVSPQRCREVLRRLAERGYIEFDPAGRAGGLQGHAATIRRLPLQPRNLYKGETNQ